MIEISNIGLGLAFLGGLASFLSPCVFSLVPAYIGYLSGNQLIVITENGFGKRTDLKQYKIQKRGGTGIKTAKVTAKTGKVVGAHVISMDALDEDMLVTSAKGQIIRIPLKSISVLGRATQGVRIMRPGSGDKVSAAAIL